MIGEFHAALLQGIVTLGAAAACWALYRRYRRNDLLWWSVAWSLYVLRIAAIIAFVATRASGWLFVHQVLTGWTALALLWAALTYGGNVRWRPAYALAPAFPLLWSYLAIYQMESFLLAALPAVAFLSVATFATGWVFLRQWRTTKSRGSLMLAVVLITWALHHLDYPILRARGAWDPWGYYLDILFVIAMGIGIVNLLLEQVDRRTRELEWLGGRMLRQHEDERRRISRELHDQSAQVWAAVKMQLGLVRESAPPTLATPLDRALALVDTGIRSIRDVTTNLRPPLLDDLGLVPALRALAGTFSEQTGLAIRLDAPDEIPQLTDDASLALYRALQEALSNVARHSGASSVIVHLSIAGDAVRLSVTDNGRGFPARAPAGNGANASSYGLTGMRERIAALRGSLVIEPSRPTGAAVTVTLPLEHVSRP